MVGQDIGEDKKDKTVVIVGQKTSAADKKILGKIEKRKKRKKLTKKESEAVARDAIRILSEPISRAAKSNTGWGTLAKSRLKGGPLQASSNFPGNPSSSLINHAKGMFARKNRLKGIHVDVQTLGIPSLSPAEVVSIDGFAIEGQKEGIFDGLYGVIEVRHKVGLGGFTTTFKAISNFIPRAFALAMGAAGVKHVGRIPDNKRPKKNPVCKDGTLTIEPK